MKHFFFIGFDSTNAEKSGTHRAMSADVAARELVAKGLTLVSLSERAPSFRPRPRKIGFVSLSSFIEEWARLTKYGLSIDQAIRISRQSAKKSNTARALDRIYARLREGSSLDVALAEEVDDVPLYVQAGIASAIRSGQLEAFLNRLAKRLRDLQHIRSQALTAAIYPAFLMAACGAVMLILLYVVIPTIETFVDNRGSPIFAVAALTREALPFGFAAAGVIALIAAGVSRTAAGRFSLHEFLLRLPAIGGKISLFYAASFCRTLAAQLDGGVPLIPAVQMSAATIASLPIQKRAEQVAEKLREGATLERVFATQFPDIEQLSNFVSIGSQTGRLSEMLDCAADYFERDLERTTRIVMAAATPLITLVAGVVVGAVVLSLMDAISQLSLSVAP